MLDKTKLVIYLLDRANYLRDTDGRRALTANYFMVALLEVIDAKEDSRLPSELNKKATLDEIARAELLLEKYNIEPKKNIQDIMGFIHSDTYDSAIDEFIFTKIGFTVERFARRKDSSEIDAGIYAEMIIQDPTNAIKTVFSIPSRLGGDKGTSAIKSSEAMLDELSAMISSTKAKTESKGTKTAAAPRSRAKTAPKPKKNETGELGDIVRSTSKIQKFLLHDIFGQDLAVNTFVAGYFQSELMGKIKKDKNKPKATFLFAGPPGVGKTFLAEKAAEALGLPYRRFDMSEYSEEEANLEFCGSDKVYKNGKVGNVTSFVSENPKCVLLFDEIEKAHLNVIHLFLQMLDAGRLRDNFSDEEVSFSEAVIIFTTNAGKNLYENSKISNLSMLPRKTILKAISQDKHPISGNPLFPAAICSRFASGNVVMFNQLVANHLFTIASGEIEKNVSAFERSMGIHVDIDGKVPSALILAEGGKADARTVKGRATAFFNEELYELLRLLSDDEGAIDKLTNINVRVSLDNAAADIKAMFVNSTGGEVLIFADEKKLISAKKKFLPGVKHYITNDIQEAKEILFDHDISVVLVDVFCGIEEDSLGVLNAEDVHSRGSDFMNYVLCRSGHPVYIIQCEGDDISREEMLSFAKIGVRDVLSTKNKSAKAFEDSIIEKCDIAYQQNNMLKLAKENKVVMYKTAQSVDESGSVAEIRLFDFKLALAADTEDSKSIVDNVSRPNILFRDVIGAEDAKAELQYFVNYLRDPIKYMRKGVRAPRGILLYGPPGTGKTMLARAMAGESDVTFLSAEGNQFLKSRIGEGADAVHKIFESARKYAPSILFIDEIDAIARTRGSSNATEYTNDVLTAFLAEMDGFSSDDTKPVFILAATNYDAAEGKTGGLDPALMRRFDRRMFVDLPNNEERKRFLAMKNEKNNMISLSEEQISNIAMRSTGMSLAELDSIFEMAMRGAIRRDDAVVDDAAFEEAFETFFGGEKREWDKAQLERTARHEAGHALVSWLAGDKPSYLTIVSRGDRGGYMQHGNSEDKGIYIKSELEAKIRTSLAGRAAELVYYGEEGGLSTGASSDIAHATEVAEDIITKYGMDSVIGLGHVGAKLESTAIYRAVYDRVNVILGKELESAKQIISNNRLAMDKIVEALLEVNRLKENEIDEIFSKYAKQ